MNTVFVIYLRDLRTPNIRLVNVTFPLEITEQVRALANTYINNPAARPQGRP